MSSSMNVATGLSSRTPMPSNSSTSTSSMGRHPLLSRGGGNLAADVTVAGHEPRSSGPSEFESIEGRGDKTRLQERKTVVLGKSEPVIGDMWGLPRMTKKKCLIVFSIP